MSAALPPRQPGAPPPRAGEGHVMTDSPGTSALAAHVDLRDIERQAGVRRTL
jgi:hypothetical protein